METRTEQGAVARAVRSAPVNAPAEVAEPVPDLFGTPVAKALLNPSARPSVLRPEERHLSPAVLLHLQRSAGNGAVADIVQRLANGSALTLQRDLTEDQKKSWERLDGPKFIQALKTSVEEWKKFRQSPDAYEKIPRAGRAPGQLADLLATGEKAYAQYAAEQLGHDAVKYLGEMAGFMPECRSLIGAVPGVAWVDPAHKYVLKSDSGGGGFVLNKIPMLPVGAYTVEYTNAYGWKWTKNLTGTQAQWKVGIGYERGKGAKGSGLIPMPATVSINSEATATSVGYWGYKDVAGVVSTANGPSVKGTYRGWGVKTPTGGVITIHGTGGGPPGSLTFMNLAHKIDIKPTGPTRPKDLKKDVEVSLSLVDAGGGALVGGDQTVAIPAMEPKPVPEHKEWHYVLSGFETGDPNVPIPAGEVHPIMNLIKSDIADKQKNVESIKPMLKEAGIEQEFKLAFSCEGYASRRWAGAGTDAGRQMKNLELSKRRAENVVASLGDTFGTQHAYRAEGKGGAFVLTGGRFGEAVAEMDPTTVEAKVKEREEQIRSRNRGEFTDDQIEQMVRSYREGLMSSQGKKSDVPIARRVNITVVWDGYNIQFAAGATPGETPRQ